MPNRKPTGLPPGPRHNYTGQQNADRALNMRLTPEGWKALDLLAKAFPKYSRARFVSEALISYAFDRASPVPEEQPPEQRGGG